ncbi:uncharacterized protein LOC8273687 [Ricinus communis]|uniref:uncharacterized protein LOC8273687 n=1 Tax=Ricinus communis TaxID=3988 RepID=UPI000772C16E|nr:uncharacterized protein LOC8273687 [Ricinus communis]|eukprot:XP_015583458.1 uncharacterized protein LOC8273687 [Ricinus communis]
MIMAELQAVYRIDNVLTDSEMVAAQQLMQLSDEDNSSSINKNSSNRNRKNIYEDEELDRRSQDEITSKKIEEIFGKDEELEQERPKKKRFRSIKSIYKATKPINLDMKRITIK